MIPELKIDLFFDFRIKLNQKRIISTGNNSETEKVKSELSG